MSKDKQIEEMAKVILEEPHLGGIQGFEERIAERLYNAGYRKSEWISVEERLPEEGVRVLVCLDSDRSYTKFDTDRLLYGKWARWYMDVTHWMPLPMPPKGDGV